MKRTISILLFVVIAILLLSLGLTANAALYSGTCGQDLIWMLDTENGELIISGTGAMKDYYSPSEGTSKTAPWRSYRSEIKSVTIDNGVTSIGSYAFYECSALTSVTIPDSVTSIGNYAFYECSALTSVTIPDSVTSIGNYAFYGCTGLTSVTIGSSVTSIGNYAFENCYNLASITIPDSVTSIGAYAFWGCTGLTSVTIPDSVTSIGSSAFSFCRGLPSLTIPDSVTSIGNYAFWGCTGLTSVTIGSGVMSIGHDAFLDCTSLAEVHIADVAAWCQIAFDSMEANPFYYGKNLYLNGTLITDLVIPDSVTSIGDYAFYKCSSLTSAMIGSGVTSIGKEAFSGCSGLTSVTIGSGVMSIGHDAFFDCTSLAEVHIADVAAWCQIAFDSMEANPFYYGKNLYLNGTLITDLVIPDSVTSIGDYAFYKCSSLTSVMIGSGVTSIGDYAFSVCTGLTAVHITDVAAWCGITFPGDYANPLRYAHNLYLNGELVTDLVIPDSVTSIGDYAFYKCSSLTSAMIGSGVTSIGKEAFSGCRGLTSLTIPDSVTSINDRAFSSCTELTSVTIPDSVTSIGKSSFADCANLTEMTLPFHGQNAYLGYLFGASSYENNSSYVPATLKTIIILGSYVSSYALYGCSNLTSVKILDGVYSINKYAFFNCSNLERITLPDSLKSIGESAFFRCSNLANVFYYGTETEWEAVNIRGNNDPLTGARIFYNWGEHVHDCTTVVTEPTCTEQGYTTYTCTICGDSYVDDYVNALGHDLVTDAAVAATCTEAGLTAGEHCSRCDYRVEQEVVPALGHDFVDHEAQAATCTEIGWDAYQTCSRCDYTSYEEIEALGHDFVQGVCTRCGEKDPNYQPTEAVAGDLNSDGEVDTIDSIRLAKFLVDLVELTDEQIKAADVNGDGDVTALDGIRLAKYLVGLVEALRPEPAKAARSVS